MRTPFSSRVGFLVGLVTFGTFACRSDCSGGPPSANTDAAPIAITPGADALQPQALQPDAAVLAGHARGDASAEPR